MLDISIIHAFKTARFISAFGGKVWSLWSVEYVMG